MDIVGKETRSRMMSGIKGVDTQPELILRRGLHRRGFRYRLHDRRLPGKPDLVFPRHKAVIFVNGCFWHGHDCHLFRWPKSREEFWRSKITGNMQRDARNQRALIDKGWRVLVVWECALKGKEEYDVAEVVRRAMHWLRTASGNKEIRGDAHGC